MPNRALFDVDLVAYAKSFGVPYFRGVYMRDALPKRPWNREAVIVNLDSSSGGGTHWVCFRKNGKRVDYFDSYGDLKPPLEIQRYLAGNYLAYNRAGLQSVNTDSQICGHLCLAFLLMK